MFGMIEALMGFLQRQLGTRADAVGSGSLFALTKEMRDPVVNGYARGCVKSVQRGVLRITSSSQSNVTIAAVNPAKCSVTLYGSTATVAVTGTYDPSYAYHYFPYVASLTSTTLSIGRYRTQDWDDFSWEIVEFY